MIAHRRSLLLGLGALLVTPAVVRASSIMPVVRQPITATWREITTISDAFAVFSVRAASAKTYTVERFNVADEPESRYYPGPPLITQHQVRDASIGLIRDSRPLVFEPVKHVRIPGDRPPAVARYGNVTREASFSIEGRALADKLEKGKVIHINGEPFVIQSVTEHRPIHDNAAWALDPEQRR